MKLFENPVARFFIIAVGAYFLWYAIYDLYLLPHTKFDEKIIANLGFISEFFLNLTGVDAQFFPSSLSIDGKNTMVANGISSVNIGERCDGVAVISLFIIFILAYPAKISSKLWFIPLGAVVLHFINMLRIVALVHIYLRAPEYLEFNHDYVFTTVVYSCVFGLWYFFIKKVVKAPPKQIA